MFIIEIPGDPRPKSRPRFSGKRAFAPKEDVQAEAHIAELIDEQMEEPIEGPAYHDCLTNPPWIRFTGRPGTTRKRHGPHGRFSSKLPSKNRHTLTNRQPVLPHPSA